MSIGKHASRVSRVRCLRPKGPRGTGGGGSSRVELERIRCISQKTKDHHEYHRRVQPHTAIPLWKSLRILLLTFTCDTHGDSHGRHGHGHARETGKTAHPGRPPHKRPHRSRTINASPAVSVQLLRLQCAMCFAWCFDFSSSSSSSSSSVLVAGSSGSAGGCCCCCCALISAGGSPWLYLYSLHVDIIIAVLIAPLSCLCLFSFFLSQKYMASM